MGNEERSKRSLRKKKERKIIIKLKMCLQSTKITTVGT